MPARTTSYPASAVEVRGDVIPTVASRLPQRRSMGDDVYELLLGLLMNRTIDPGGRISIDGLSRQLEVSPTPIREALTRLEAEGLVHKSLNRGYTAAPVLDDSGLEHLFAMRLLLEPAASREAAGRIGEPDLAELERLMTGMREFVDAGPESEAYEGYRGLATQDAAFHALIAQRSGNPLLGEAIVRLRPHMHLFRLYFERGIASQTEVEHRAILTALRDHDPDAAEQAMREHITCSRHRMVGHRAPARVASPG